MKLKQLNQSEFPLKIIKDLGIQFLPSGTAKKRYMIAECSICKKGYRVICSVVKSGKSYRCVDCYNKNRIIENNIRKEKLYGRWRRIKQRCTDRNVKEYMYYGGRGISICDEWSNSYESFRNWALASGYSNELTIDRINNDGNYEPSNCRWVGRATQARNTRILRTTNKSGFKGAFYNKKNKNYRSTITINTKKINIGSFDTKIEAARAYNKYIIDNNLEHTLNIV